jgi:hypothetical protein
MSYPFTKTSAITNVFHGVVDRHLEVMCAKDGRFIFINKKVMAIFARHVLKAKYMNFNSNAHSDMKSLNFGNQYWKKYLIYQDGIFGG